MGNGRLRVAYVQFGPQSGVTPSVARALAALGHEVLLVTATGDLELRDRQGRRRLRPAALLGLAAATARFGRAGPRRRWNTPFAFDRHSRRAGLELAALSPPPDVVLQNGVLFAPGAPPRLPYVLLLDHTSALAARGGDGPRFPAAWFERERETYRRAAAVCTFSEATAASVRGDYGVAAARVHVVGAGPNVLPAAPPPRRDDGRTVLFVGIDFERKGGRTLLEAFRAVRAREPAARLLVAGPTAPLALPPGAEQLGRVPVAELPGLFARATVFTMPSVREPFGLAYLDAMACGVPCVGTRVDAIPEILAGGEAGLLVPPRDPAALAAALLRLLAEPGRARALGLAGRRRVEERYRWELVAGRLEAALRRAAEGSAAEERPGALAWAPSPAPG